MTTPWALLIAVEGVPAPQGSKDAFVNKRTGRAQLVESSKKVKPWRAAVRDAALDALDKLTRQEWDEWQATIKAGAHVEISFFMPRPKSHYGTGRNASVLKRDAPERHTYKPDLDKLARAVLDALTMSGAIHDDANVDRLIVTKQWAHHLHPGATIRITPDYR